MLIKFKYILFIFLSVQIVNSQVFTENALMNYKKSSYYNTNYNGPVKSSFWYYTFIIDPIPFAQSSDSIVQALAKNSVMVHNRIALAGNMYNKFDEKGRLAVVALMDQDISYFGKSKLNDKTASIYTYDETDWMNKNKIKRKKQQIYPVNDYEVLSKPNYTVLTGRQNNLIYKYTYSIDEKGRILQEIWTGDELDPYTESTFVYDNQDNLKKIDIRTKQKDPIPFHFLDTETGFCPDLHIAYEYDNKDRMTQVTYYGCKDTLAFEKYVYHPEKGFVTERTRFIKSSMRGVEHITPTMIFYHNENGDIIEKKYVRSYPKQYLGARAIALRESIYYKYEYDKYNNWIKCYIYMEGKPEDSEPTAIAQRDLEYYDS